jgi:transcription initiation factor TFIIIB Brf1 subunit/transcription initiation factor TFIIB
MVCGTVVEESTIVSSIEFQETGDRSHVIGQFVAANCSKPYMSSSRMMGRHADNRDSKETTLLNARRILAQISATLRLPSIFIDRAHRLYQLALQRNYSVGRRQANILATCLYIICRQEKSPHLLIDFSDALQINVYLLGKAFLHFTKIININLDVIDPSLYIHRYADKLEFGDKMNSVVTASLRIITRLKKDWIVMGRRPDGVCAAALLISARAHEFGVTQDTIAQLFRISMDTVRKRILEFRNTPSAQLTIQQFINVGSEAAIEYDPPSYIRNTLITAHDESLGINVQFGEEESGDSANILPQDLVKDKVYNVLSEYETDGEDEIDDNETGNNARSKRRKRASAASSQSENGFSYTIGNVDVVVPLPNMDRQKRPADIVLSRQREQVSLYDDIYTEIFESVNTQDDANGLDNAGINALLEESKAVEAAVKSDLNLTQTKLKSLSAKSKSRLKEKHLVITVALSQSNTADSSSATPSVATKHVRHSILNSDTGISEKIKRAGELDEEENAFVLSDTEADGLLLSPEESLKRAALFNKAYGSFMEQRDRKKRAREQAAANQDTDRFTQTGKLRKKFAKKIGAVNNSSASQAAVTASRSSVKGASKKINYEALQGVFGEDGGFKVPELPNSSSGLASRANTTVRSVAGDLPRLPAFAAAAVAASGAPGAVAAAAPTTAVRVPVGVGLNKNKGNTLVQPNIAGSASSSAANPTAATKTNKDGTAANTTMEEEYEDDDEFIDEPYGGYSEYYEEDYS